MGKLKVEIKCHKAFKQIIESTVFENFLKVFQFFPVKMEGVLQHKEISRIKKKYRQNSNVHIRIIYDTNVECDIFVNFETL